MTAAQKPHQGQQPTQTQPASSSASAVPAGGGRGAIQLKASLRGHDYETQVQMLAPEGGKNGGGAGAVHEAAAAGTAGGGKKLPHVDKIQKSFGGYDISNVQAHTGGAAAASTEAMGADAYATGNHVVFGAGRDTLHTAAHEAAHVVQQDKGVALSGGVGKANDQYEKHADAVADQVVQGKSAEDLLGQMAGGGGAGEAVQRKESGSDKAPGSESKGAWQKACDQAIQSYDGIFDKQYTTTIVWKGKADKEESPARTDIEKLAQIGLMVVSAAFGGIGGTLAAKLLSEESRTAAHVLMRAAIDANVSLGKNMAKEGGDAGHSVDRKTALDAYFRDQLTAIDEARRPAKKAVYAVAGDFDNQLMTIADFQDIEKKNAAAETDAERIQGTELFVGWMNLQAGETTKTPGTKDAAVSGDIQSIDNNGILRIVINGASDSPQTIVEARAGGMGPALRKEMVGTKVGDWLVGGEKARSQGINVLVTTATGLTQKGFGLSDATWDRIRAAGLMPTAVIGNKELKRLFFSFFVESTGNLNWTDSDKNNESDNSSGADAGRWFLDNVKNAHQILDELRGMTLPAVLG